MMYQLMLDELDSLYAVFAAGEDAASVVLPRKHWEDLGRPGMLEVKVTGFDG